MTVHPVLLILWGALAACFLALLAYRGQLTRYEDEQLFLSDNTNHNAQNEQTEIVRKVTRLRPLLQLFGGAAAVMTASVVGLYVWQAVKVLR